MARVRIPDLNTLLIPDERQGTPLKDYSTPPGMEPEMVLRGVRSRLVQLIGEADAVVGCVAWLTCEHVLRALAQKKALVIVQKEDFLRPDGPTTHEKLRQLYRSVPALNRPQFDFLSDVSYLGGNEGDAIRCVGNHNATKKPAHPRMHNKFVLFCRLGHEDQYGIKPVEPYAVWTGSFNFTFTASNSFENAVITRAPHVVAAAFAEFQQIAALSEPLDWEHPWVAPEWRIGS